MRKGRAWLMLLGIVPLILFLVSCSEQIMTQPAAADLNQDNRPSWRLSDEIISVDLSAYPQSASGTAYFQRGSKGYLGFKMTVANGSTFWLDNGSLTPPVGTKKNSNVTITMKVDQDPVTNELVFTFGPSGCTFDPPAEVYLDWKDLDAPDAKLFLLDDDGSRVETFADGVDRIGRTYFLRIPHFSRYAVAYSD